MASELKELVKSVSLLRVASAAGLKFTRRGEEYWACCPFHGENTPSFAVRIKDGKEVFFCQGCSKGGDVLTFIELNDKCTKRAALEKLKGMSCDPKNTGGTFVQNSEYTQDTAKVAGAFVDLEEAFRSAGDLKAKVSWPSEKWLPFATALAVNEAALEWLETARGIGRETALRLRLGYTTSCKGHVDDESARHKGWILFPRFSGDGDKERLVACKMRSISTKAFSQWPGMEPSALFNAGASNALEDVFITEGEFDTAIFEQADFRAQSIPNAAAKLTPENKIIMKRAQRVFLAGDNDGGVGNAAMHALRRELGENTYTITWPGAKDSNEFFIKVCNRDIALFKTKVAELVEQTLSTPVDGFTSLVERLRIAAKTGTNVSGDINRLHFPFAALDNMSYSVPGSVVTFYSTYSGTGKTIFITQMMLAEAERGETVVVYSPEVRDTAYLALVASQTIGPKRLPTGLNRADEITPADYQETLLELSKPTERNTPLQFYVGHALPTSDGEKSLDFVETIIKATGATRFVIDTLYRFVQQSGRENLVEAEGRTMRRLEELAIKYNMIFIVIGQSNKEAEDLKEVRKDAHGTMRGNREITDISDAVYLIHRKRVAGELKEGMDPLEMETTIVLVKGRAQGTTGKFAKMIYKWCCSRFYPMSNSSTNSSGPQGGMADAPPPSYEESKF